MTCVLLSTVVCSTTSLSNFVSPGTVHRYSWYFNSPGTCTARLLYQVPSLFFFFRYRAKQCLISNCSMYVCEIHFLLIWLLLTTNYMANNTGKVWHWIDRLFLHVCSIYGCWPVTSQAWPVGNFQLVFKLVLTRLNRSSSDARRDFALPMKP